MTGTGTGTEITLTRNGYWNDSRSGWK
jgi:hypothetical protein